MSLLFAIPAAAEPATGCRYPSIHVEEGSTRNTALKAYQHYEATQGEVAAPGCVQNYVNFLHSVAYAQQAAGNANRRAEADFRAKELSVRQKLFEELNSGDMPRPLVGIYKNNLQRLMDLYQFNSAAKEFLDDIVAEDKNFAETGYPIVAVRNTVRKAIYSCARWDFTHTKDLVNMKPRWVDCRSDFEELARRIPRFGDIAPAAVRFLSESVGLTVEPSSPSP